MKSKWTLNPCAQNRRFLAKIKGECTAKEAQEASDALGVLEPILEEALDCASLLLLQYRGFLIAAKKLNVYTYLLWLDNLV